MNRKRILSLIMVFCMVLSLLPADVLAVDPVVTFTMVADKDKVSAGEIVTFTGYISEVKNLAGMVLHLDIPAGLTYVSGSSVVPESLITEYNFYETIFDENGLYFMASSRYWSDLPADVAILSFQCVVNDSADGQLCVGFKINMSSDVFDSDYNDMPSVTIDASIKVVTFCNHTYANGICSDCDVYQPAVLNNGVYEISNAGQLYWFAAKVNGGDNAINGKLIKDIVINENVLNVDGTLNGDGSNFRTWTPIGIVYMNYVGVFDGNGMSVSGLYYNNDSSFFVGLFGYVASSGIVKCVSVLNSFIKADVCVGGVVGYNDEGNVIDCYSENNIVGSFECGGIVGRNYGGSIIGCKNYGRIFCEDNTGGITGFNGGIVRNCDNYGPIIGENYNIGGVIGYNYGIVEICRNYGSVFGKCAGGIAGGQYGEEIRNCINLGSITGSDVAGGVVGRICEGGLNSSYNIAEVKCTTSDYGGVTGINYEGWIENCYTLSSCVTNGNSYGTAKTVQQFASGEVAYLLQGDQAEQVWGQTIGTDAYPVLGGKKICKNSSTYYNCVGTWLAATCTTPKTCTICGATMGTALGHSWKAATCTSPKSCTVCGLTEGDVLPHTWTEATCTKPSTCTTCGATTGNALGHNWKAATCTKPKTCTVCGETSGSALGHKWTNATCTEPKTCTVCGATTGTALGHSWKAATCTKPKTCNRCGLTEGNPLGHRWTEATCTAPKTCTTCGTTSGKALGHIEVVIPGYAATYEAPGLTDGSYCSRCGDTLQEHAVIDPIPEEVFFSYKAYGINGSTNAVNSGYITVEIWMNVNSDFARVWGADIGLSFNQNLTLLDIQGGIFEEALATPLNIANAYNAVKMTQDMVLGDDKTFQQGQYLFATLTFKVDKNFHSQNAAFLVDVDECSLIRKGEFANELVTDFGTGTNIYISKLGDANRDGKISAADTMALSSWLQNADLDDYNAVFDLNKDGYIDGDDFALLRGAIVWDNGYLDI